jgi:N-acetylmuramoyl-L-alanine amidase/Stage II sporulation protein
MTSFTIALASATPITDEDSVTITIASAGVSKSLGLEISGDEDGVYYTAPLHFEPTSTLSIECTREWQPCGMLELIALNTRATTSRLSFGVPASGTAHAADGDTITGSLTDRIPGVNVISRAQWGADENLRYEEWAVWTRIRAAQAIAQEKAIKDGIQPSAATLKIRAKNSAIEDHLRSSFPEEFLRSELIRKEWANTLVWPIEKSKYVRKIVLHHTAEDNLKGLPDAELLRSIYYYHTVVRGWGDIGYQYIIGQRGQVYEGRAWGDYAVGAHTSWNNSSTVGVSVIGNFEVDSVLREQKAALTLALGGLARKYGIDTNASIMGHKACKVDDLCATTDSLTLGIVGHRDVGATSCPGKNLYNLLLDDLRPKLAEQTRGYTLVANSIYRPETLTRPTQITPQQSSVALSAAFNQSKGPLVRIKLSIPELNRLDLEVLEGDPILTLDTTNGMTQSRTLSIAKSKRPGVKNLELTLDGKKYRGKLAAFAGTLVRVNNWDRKPTWDTSGKLNDNVFRGKLEVRVDNGKLILINELPLEDYLKWIAETSNGDARAKVETIIIAARSYAYYYTQTGVGAERKFVGKPYDGSDDPDVFQKYLGYGYEKRSPNTAAIIEATNGKILTYGGTPIKPWYFSQSDGNTLSALQYCDGRKSRGELPASAVCRDIPYLQTVPDPGSTGQIRKGHGVGISWLWATYYAREGWDAERIIKYYLKGVEIKKQY